MKKILVVVFCFFIASSFVKAEDLDLAPNAGSGILIEASTGTILYEKNIHEKYAPASMTKMMSLLLFMEYIEKGGMNLEEEIIISENASKMGGSQIYLETGEKMMVSDLLKGISIASGNDATVALAERVAGTEGAFVNMMNEKAQELGLLNTNFKNPTGLDEANHYSSAYDMSLIAKELVRHELILQYSSVYETYLREGTDKKTWLVNTNKLVRFYPGVDGLKTGYTSEALYCLTATAKKGNMRLISVVMKEGDSKVRNAETTDMLNYGFNTYEVEKLFSTDTAVGTMKIEKSASKYVEVVPQNDVTLLNKKIDPKKNVTYEIELNEVDAPIKKGDIIGTLIVKDDNNIIKESPLTVKEDVEKATLWNLYGRYIKEILGGDIGFSN